MAEIRVFGGLACRYHCPRTRDLFPCRTSQDIDCIAPTTFNVLPFHALAVSRFGLVRRTYSQYNGGCVYEFTEKLTENGPNLDLYVGNFVFSHSLSYRDRLCSDWPTLPLAELLLTKLQIHDAEQKDFEDILMLLAEHDFGESDADQINLCRVLTMCCNDYGLWYNSMNNLAAVTAMLVGASHLPEDTKRTAVERASHLRQTLGAGSKTARWQMRAALRRCGWTKCWNDVENWR